MQRQRERSGLQRRMVVGRGGVSTLFVIVALLLVATAGCRVERTDTDDKGPERLSVAVSGEPGGGFIERQERDDTVAGEPQAPEGHSLRGRAPGEGHQAAVAPPPVEPATARPKAGIAQTDNDAPPKSDDAGEDEKDYWAGVKFDRDAFEEVRRFVKVHYIDDEIDDRRALIEAANFALVSVKDQALEILPESFLNLRRGHPEEEGRLSGKSYKLKESDGYVIHEIPKRDDERFRRRLSDYEILHLRLRDKARHALLERHWANVSFQEADFTALLAEAQKRGAKDAETRPDDVYIAAAQGYLYSLDPHSSLVSAAAWEESTRQTEDASFDGIGAVLTQRENETIVESPIEGQPAEKAGLRAGDVILAVDHKEVEDLPLFKVVKRIRGPRNTPVTLTIRRLGIPDDFDITITRARIAIKNVSGRLLPAPYEDIGYLKLTGFVRSSTVAFDEMVRELEAQTSSGQLRGLIFDMRSNTGGLLSQGISIADRFLEDGIIVSVRNKAEAMPMGGGGAPEVYRATPDRTVTCPVVVLVDDGTASAAEIVASALQENKRGLVIGERTFGKASVQTLYPPPGDRGYYIKLTVARYYAPSGRTIQLSGVAPDIAVAPEVGRPMPAGFREENLRNPLSRVSSGHYRSPMADTLPALRQCVAREGQAEKIHAADPNPQIKFDYQLYKGADYLECVIDQTNAAKSN